MSYLKITNKNNLELVEVPNSINALIILPNHVLLAKQYRPGADAEILNLMGGTIKEGETPLECFYRELKEEFNIDEDQVFDLGSLYENALVSPGYSTERNTLFIAMINPKLDLNTIKCNDAKEGITPTFVYHKDYLELPHISVRMTVARIGFVEKYKEFRRARMSKALQEGNFEGFISQMTGAGCKGCKDCEDVTCEKHPAHGKVN